MAFSPPAWAAGHGGGGGGFAGGGGGFHGGGFGGGFRGGGFGCWRFSWRRFGCPTRWRRSREPRWWRWLWQSPFWRRRFRAAPYRYRGTHFAARSLGGPTGAFRYYNGGSQHVCCPDIPIQWTGKSIDEIECRQERNRCSPAESPGITNKAKHEDLERSVVSAVRRAMANHRVFARHDGNWHHDWDRHHAHFDHGHVFVFTDGFWWGLYPWDYYPYDAYSSYPSDSYDYPYGYNDYPNGSYDYNTQDPYSYYSGYAAPAQSGNGVVSSVQSQLAKLGYYRGAVDGVAGDETQAAIARYQEDNDLSVTGTVTAATLQSLGLAER